MTHLARLLLAAVLAFAARVSATTGNSIRPFELHVSDEAVEDLLARLRNTRWPDQLVDIEPGDNVSYGAELSDVKKLVDLVTSGKYDWRERETIINSELPQFVATLASGFEMHFAHVRSSRANAVPLMIAHGWPGSFLECRRVAHLLAEPEDERAPAFHVVCPSLMGYAFSSKPTHKGFDVADVSDAIVELMVHHLGYSRYVAQGGDWGSFVARLMTHRHPESVIALHLNMFAIPMTGTWTHSIKGFFHQLGMSIAPTWFLRPEELRYNDAALDYFLNGSGYFHIQATKPQTLGYALHDSPVGLIAWIFEKFDKWTDHSGEGESVFDVMLPEHCLDSILVYWFSESITSAARTYYEFLHSDKEVYKQTFFIDQPFAFLSAPNEIVPGIRAVADYFFGDVRSWTVLERGGHFIAMERPAEYVADVRAFVASVLAEPTDQKSEL